MLYMSKNEQTRRGMERAEQHWEMAVAVDEANSKCRDQHKLVAIRTNGEILLEYIEWDLEHDPLSRWAAKVYRRRLNTLYVHDLRRVWK